jgi:hypothetical protein
MPAQQHHKILKTSSLSQIGVKAQEQLLSSSTQLLFAEVM